MQHTDSLSIPYRQRLILMDTAIRIMDLLYLILHPWVIIDNQCLRMVMNPAQDMLQCRHLFQLPHSKADHSLHLTMLSLLLRSMVIINHTLRHRWGTIILASNQILSKEMTINTLDHIIMKEITIKVVGVVQGMDINHQEIITMLGLIIHMVVTTAKASNLELIRIGLHETTRVGTGIMVSIRPINILC